LSRREEREEQEQQEVLKMTDVATKSVKCPTFEGSYEKFPQWYLRFTAYASVLGFEDSIVQAPGDPALPPTEGTVMPTSDQAEIDAKEVADKAKKRNKIAFAHLTMALTNESEMCMIYDAKTADWPSGLASLVIDALFAKFKPIDITSRV
jgi:hypothetical protein